MDPKAMAKAKRSHSQHGRKNHPTPSAVAQKKKAAQLGSEEKLRHQHSHGLPSNWGRYDVGEEEVESSSVATSAEEEVIRKSKGADLAYLIEQANLKQDGLRTSASPKSASLFDDVSLDFMQGINSMCVVRGKNLLSRCKNDNFFVDDDLKSNYEVPFLTLDLHALAAQLSKIKLSDRLFIEEDLLPEDLRWDDSKGTSSQSERLAATDDTIVQAEDHSITATTSNLYVPQTCEADDTKLETYGHVNLGQTFDTRKSEEFTTFFNQGSTSKTRAVEEELDMLLESFGKTHLFDSKKPFSNISSDGSAELERSRDERHVDSLDVTLLDDLLEKTLPNREFQKHISGASLSNSGSNSIGEHKSSSKGHSSSLTSRATTDDFDSWFDTLQ